MTMRVGGVGAEATASHIVIYKYNDDCERENFTYIPTRTELEKQRAISALLDIAEFVEETTLSSVLPSGPTCGS